MAIESSPPPALPPSSPSSLLEGLLRRPHPAARLAAAVALVPPALPPKQVEAALDEPEIDGKAVLELSDFGMCLAVVDVPGLEEN